MNTEANEETKTITFRSEHFCNSEWASTPYRVEAYLPASAKERIERMVQALKDTGGHVMTTYWSAGYEFFDEEGEVFEPDYSVDGCSMKVFRDGGFLFVFPFKHSDEEGWTEHFKWEDGKES